MSKTKHSFFRCFSSFSLVLPYFWQVEPVTQWLVYSPPEIALIGITILCLHYHLILQQLKWLLGGYNNILELSCFRCIVSLHRQSVLIDAGNSQISIVRRMNRMMIVSLAYLILHNLFYGISNQIL